MKIDIVISCLTTYSQWATIVGVVVSIILLTIAFCNLSKRITNCETKIIQIGDNINQQSFISKGTQINNPQYFNYWLGPEQIQKFNQDWLDGLSS